MSSRDEHAGLILLVEDNRQIAEMVGEFLERRGYSVDFAQDGVSGLHLAVSNSYDVVVLDLMLPGIDGLEVCRRLRAQWPIPVVMLTALGEETDRVVGFETGADDYVTKPFSPRELALRVRSVLRRARGGGLPDPPALGVIKDGNLVVDLGAHSVMLGESTLALTSGGVRFFPRTTKTQSPLLARCTL